MSFEERVSRSICASSTASGTRPTVPTPSTWKGTPRSRAIRPTARTGSSVPISPFAAMSDTSAVSSRIARDRLRVHAPIGVHPDVPPGPTGARAGGPPTLAGLADDEAEDRAIPPDLHELVPRAARPALHVRLGRGVVRRHLEDLSRPEPLHGLARLEDRHRAEEPQAIERHVGPWHRAKIL